MTEDTHDYGEDMEFDPKAGTFKEVALGHFNRCVKLMSVEFRGGYWTVIPSKDGKDKDVYISDTREIYSNAVLGLALILQPKYDKDMKEAFKNYNDNLKKIKKEFITATKTNEEIILGEAFYTSSEDKLLLETYKQKKLQIYLDLFSDTSQLLGRKNYLTVGGSDY
jgi:hypothetical protein